MRRLRVGNEIMKVSGHHIESVLHFPHGLRQRGGCDILFLFLFLSLVYVQCISLIPGNMLHLKTVELMHNFLTMIMITRTVHSFAVLLSRCMRERERDQRERGTHCFIFTSCGTIKGDRERPIALIFLSCENWHRSLWGVGSHNQCFIPSIQMHVNKQTHTRERERERESFEEHVFGADSKMTLEPKVWRNMVLPLNQTLVGRN